MKKLDYVDAIRGLAILLVIMVHASQYCSIGVPITLTNIFNQGARGVQLFFLASAFTLFLSHRNRKGKELSPVRNFFIRRFFRIAPMYYIGIFYYMCQNRFFTRYGAHLNPAIILSNFTFLHGLSPYWIDSIVPGSWSITVEMTFYAFCPFLFSKIKNINYAFILLGISLLINYLFQLCYVTYPPVTAQNLWGDYMFLFFPSQLPIFCLGIIMYFFIYEHPNINKVSVNLLLAISIIIFLQLASQRTYVLPNYILFEVAFLILVQQLNSTILKYTLWILNFLILGISVGAIYGNSMLLAHTFNYIIPNYIILLIIILIILRLINPTYIKYAVWGIPFFILGVRLNIFETQYITTDIINTVLPNHIIFGFTFLFFGVALSRNRIKILVNPIIDYIGKISFSMYLVHFAILYWLEQFHCTNRIHNGILNYVVTYGIVVALTVLLSTLSYKAIEVPFQTIGKNIIKRLEAKRAD